MISVRRNCARTSNTHRPDMGIVAVLGLLAIVAFSSAQERVCVVEGDRESCDSANIAAMATASNTCGRDGSERVCFRGGSGAGYSGECSVCDATAPSSAHPASLITDQHRQDAPTYWQSQTYRAVQHPSSVVITLNLTRVYSIDSISVLFHSARPESFTLLASNGGAFSPVHYFSRSCQRTYGVAESPASAHTTQSAPLCTADGARLAPLSGGTAVYSPASYGRGPLSASAIRLQLDRLSTYGDEQTWIEEVLDSYYYAISNVEISGSCQCIACQCNNHSTRCQYDSMGGRCLDCQHGTTGRQCDQCREGFYRSPEVPITSSSACSACTCDSRGTASNCTLAEQVRSSTGQCPCKRNVESPNCSQCTLGYSGLSADDPDGCTACPQCYDVVGSAFNNTRDLLLKLAESIASSLNTSNPEVLQRISRANESINDLWNTVNRLLERERRLQRNVTQLTGEADTQSSLVGQSLSVVESANSTVEMAIGTLSQGEQVLRSQLSAAQQVQNDLREEETAINMAKDIISSLRGLQQEIQGVVDNVSMASLEQMRTAQQLLDRGRDLFQRSTRQLSELCDAVQRQNDTLALLRNIDISSVNDVFKRADSRLRVSRIVVNNANMSSSLLQQRQEAFESSLPNFMAQQILETSQRLQEQASQLISDGASLDGMLALLRNTFTNVSVAGQATLQDARDFERLATQLLSRAMAAREQASLAVTEGNSIINTSEVLLTQLMQRFQEVTLFTTSLENLLRVIQLAENTSSMADSEAARQLELIRNTSLLVDQATTLFLSASRAIQEAMQLAAQAQSAAMEASRTASNIESQASPLPQQVDQASSTVNDLRERASNDSEAITITNNTVTAVNQRTGQVQQELRAIADMLDQLSMTVNSTTLIPQERLTNANNTLTMLRDRLNTVLQSAMMAERQINQLERQTQTLRDKFTELLQHRDLLQELLESVSQLDCINQFRGV